MGPVSRATELISRRSRMRWLSTLLALLLASMMVEGSKILADLEEYHINPSRVGVSGVSSGGYMANQVHIAFSATFRYSGIIAGGPYYCAKNNVNIALGPCMAAAGGIDVVELIDYAKQQANLGNIDDLTQLAQGKFYIFHGTKDAKVDPLTSVKLEEFLDAFVDPANVKTNYNVAAGHAFVTNDYGNSCASSNLPYINECTNGDFVGEMLVFADGNVTARGTYNPNNLLQFDQTNYRAPSMASKGFLYVPTQCANNEVPEGCGLHVALHGCQQNYENSGVNMQFVEHANYNEYAETNNIIILYPQTEVSYIPNNPNACWDWWGYSGDDYAVQSGAQMTSIIDMVNKLMSGTPSVPAPSGLELTSVSDNAVSFEWDAVEGSSSYKVFRDYHFIAEITELNYDDTGLQSGMQYAYTVQAINAQGHHSPHSAPLIVTTTGPPPPLTAPTNLYSDSQGPDYVDLSWDKVNGATKYTVLRNGQVVLNVTYTSAKDTELEPSTKYSYNVYASNDYEQGPQSNTLNVTTTSNWECKEYFDSNYDHVQADRAYTNLGYVYAVGSDDFMGLYNIADMTTLAETSKGYFEVGSC